MKQIKKFGLIVAALGALALTANAQIGSPSVVVQTGSTTSAVTAGSAIWTNTIGIGVSFTNMTGINCTGAKALHLQFRGGSTGTPGDTLTARVILFKNLDGTGLVGTASGSLQCNINMTNAQQYSVWTIPLTAEAGGVHYSMTNFTRYTAPSLPPWVYIGVITNSCTGASLTNVTIKAVLDMD